MLEAVDLEKLEKNLQVYHEKLRNTNKRNRSVLLKKIYIRHNFDLGSLGAKDSGRVLAALLRRRPVNILRDSVDTEDADVMRARLEKLAFNLSLIEGETGVHTGYLGFPFIQGHVRADFYVRGPLVLFPVSLERKRQPKNGGWYLNPVDTSPSINGALVSAIRKKGEIDPPDDMEDSFNAVMEEMEEYRGEDPAAEFVRLVSGWASDVLGIRGAQATLGPMPALTKSDIDGMDNQPLMMADYRILGNFPQAASEIYDDYRNLRNITGSGSPGPMEGLLGIWDPGADPGNESVDLDNTPDIRVNSVLDSDSSQDQVIIKSKGSNLVVVRGPPGTGKSQVITNMIADALSNKEKVLVVCQKRAALEVVRQRLGREGLEGFAVMLDKESRDRKTIYNQLLGVMSDSTDYMAGETMTLGEISGEIDRRTSKLVELKKALRKEYLGGASADRIYTAMGGRYRPCLDLRSAGLAMQWNGLDPYIEKFRRLEPLYKRFDLPGSPWSGRVDFAGFDNAKKAWIHSLLEGIAGDLEEATMTPSRDMQDEISGHLETYVGNPGFLGRRRRYAAGQLSALGMPPTDREHARGMLPGIRAGALVWGRLPELLSLFREGEHARITSSLVSGGLPGMISRMISSMTDFGEMQSYDSEKEAADVMAVMEMCARKMDHTGDWARAVRNEILSMWLDVIEAENTVLRRNPRELHMEERDAIIKLYGRKRELVKNIIRSGITGSVPKRRTRGVYTADGTSWEGLAKELKRKRMVKPMRRLFGMYADQLLKVAPCWLASPESVSKVFPLRRGLFDLVIVDEASQLPAERSLPFLYRAKRAVIAGDEKQLQPFDLFQTQDDDEVEDEDVYAEKSLFDVAILEHTPVELAWHYRSEHQYLINFSNHAFYGGNLRVAPSVVIKARRKPIRWVQCSGMWAAGVNHVEADRVLDLVRDIWEEHGDNPPSVGVITFNDAQRELIEGQLQKRRFEDPDFGVLYGVATEGKSIDELPFVKNIENVQGDERDIIIFSIGYAKDPEGKFLNNFGPLSKAGGENRLNVAITRAKKEMIIACSIDPSEIKPTSKNPGPRLLRQFLEYSQAAGDSNERGMDEVLQRLGDPGAGDGIGETESVFEEQVMRELVGRGYDVHPQAGSSGYRIDLAVVHPDDPGLYVAGIECDGAMYHSGKSARERDVMRQKFLEGKGWRILRIWSKNWWDNREAEMDRITAKIEEFRKSD